VLQTADGELMRIKAVEGKRFEKGFCTRLMLNYLSELWIWRNIVATPGLRILSNSISNNDGHNLLESFEKGSFYQSLPERISDWQSCTYARDRSLQQTPRSPIS